MLGLSIYVIKNIFLLNIHMNEKSLLKIDGLLLFNY
jgi:hypothetical protein